MTTTTPRRPATLKPQRYLAPHLSSAIRNGKHRSGLSWRGLAAETGISRAHLNNLSLGRRVPSQRTAEVIINALGLDADIADELRAAAAPMWWERLDEDR